MLVRNQALSQLPNNEPDTFDGIHITKYHSFMLSFERTIESKCISDKDWIDYLQPSTKCRPRELVISFNGPHAAPKLVS